MQNTTFYKRYLEECVCVCVCVGHFKEITKLQRERKHDLPLISELHNKVFPVNTTQVLSQVELYPILIEKVTVPACF
jgi:hypothetical protein